MNARQWQVKPGHVARPKMQPTCGGVTRYCSQWTFTLQLLQRVTLRQALRHGQRVSITIRYKTTIFVI